MIKINNFRGDLSDISAETATLDITVGHRHDSWSKRLQIEMQAASASVPKIK